MVNKMVNIPYMDGKGMEEHVGFFACLELLFSYHPGSR